MSPLKLETLECRTTDYSRAHIHRAKVPGGWLILKSLSDNSGIAFYPDPEHAWDGGSLP